eukprot:6371219-Amphidinium_carterae.1
MAADSEEYVTDYPLKEQYIEYMTIIEGDTKEDGIRLQQLQDLDDDIQSISDKEYYEKREREKIERQEQTYWGRNAQRTMQDEMDDAYRGEQARDRQLRRDERVQERFEGTEDQLRNM